jgi:hypothetical protein
MSPRQPLDPSPMMDFAAVLIGGVRAAARVPAALAARSDPIGKHQAPTPAAPFAAQRQAPGLDHLIPQARAILPADGRPPARAGAVAR